MSHGETDIQRVSEWLTQARSIAVLTGAGVSAESGLATFRDPEEGLWAKYDPMELATIDAFERDPELVTRWYHWRFTKAMHVEPNPGHVALAELEQLMIARGGKLSVVTQNVDGLHQRGGSSNVTEIHGSILRWRCTKTGDERTLEDLMAHDAFSSFPVASQAGGLMRPCVVWFGEMLPAEAIEAATEAVTGCDVFLSIGTSATVYPAAGFIEIARSAGARCVEINRDPTPVTGMVDVSLRGLSGELLPQIVQAAGERA